MSVPLFLVDAFADAPFAGNPAAVCLLDAPADPFWMQAVAAELQQPATAFVHPVQRAAHPAPGAEANVFSLRWFVPAAELLARRDGDAVVLDFPAPPHLVEALGVQPRAVLRGRLDYLVELASDREVRSIQPDMARLRQVETRGTIVTAPADASADYEVVSRFFAPAFGLNEDSVTGSAHCVLGPYWGERLGRTRLRAYQASARGGLVRVDLDGERVLLAGSAVTVLCGALLAPPPPA